MRLVPCPCVVLNGHGRNSSRHATWRTRRRTGRRRLLADFQGHRHAIAERHDRRDHPRVFRKPFVVGPDGLGLARSVLAGHVAAPEDIVRDEEPSDPTIGHPSSSPCRSTARSAASPRFANPSMYSSISSYTIARGTPPPRRRASCAAMNLRGSLTNTYPT